MSQTKRFCGLTFAAVGKEWHRGSVRIVQHCGYGRWIATAPGMSAVADLPDDALQKLIDRVASAARELRVEVVR